MTETRVTTAGAAAVAAPGQWSNREAQIIKTLLGQGLQDDDLRVYSQICRHTGLDPFKRQIHAWKDGGKLTVHIGIGGWRQMATRSGQYAGQVGPFWCGPDGEWRDVWLSPEPPAAAKVGILRRGFGEPTWGVVTFAEFGRKTPIWSAKPAHMLAIRAEYHALQKACPEAFEETAAVLAEYSVDVEVTADEELPEPPPRPQLPAGDGDAPNWRGFWAEARDLGFSREDVHAIAEAESIKEWNAEDVEELLDKLRLLGGARTEE